jgi:hypothetical protein
MLARDVQPLNAHNDIVVTLLGMLMLLSIVQFLKAPFPIEVTPSGIVTLVIKEQSLKALGPILITPSGIITSALLPTYFSKTDKIIKSDTLSLLVMYFILL